MTMFRAGGIAAGILVLFGFYVLVHYLIIGMSAAFGEGVFVGFMLNFGLWYFTWRISPESFYRPPEER